MSKRLRLTAQQLFDATQWFNSWEEVELWCEGEDFYVGNGQRVYKLDKGYGAKRAGYKNSWKAVEHQGKG